MKKTAKIFMIMSIALAFVLSGCKVPTSGSGSNGGGIIDSNIEKTISATEKECTFDVDVNELNNEDLFGAYDYIEMEIAHDILDADFAKEYGVSEEVKVVFYSEISEAQVYTKTANGYKEVHKGRKTKQTNKYSVAIPAKAKAKIKSSCEELKKLYAGNDEYDYSYSISSNAYTQIHTYKMDYENERKGDITSIFDDFKTNNDMTKFIYIRREDVNSDYEYTYIEVYIKK